MQCDEDRLYLFLHEDGSQIASHVNCYGIIALGKQRLVNGSPALQGDLPFSGKSAHQDTDFF
jgi:hypothetical protein